jgi:hypothetical protein
MVAPRMAVANTMGKKPVRYSASLILGLRLCSDKERRGFNLLFSASLEAKLNKGKVYMCYTFFSISAGKEIFTI